MYLDFCFKHKKYELLFQFDMMYTTVRSIKQGK